MSLYFAVMVLSILAATLLVLISVSVSQIKIVWALTDSVNAFYAADTGVERALYRIRIEGNFDNFSGQIGNALYNVTILSDAQTVIRSVGQYKNTKRAIETTY